MSLKDLVRGTYGIIFRITVKYWDDDAEAYAAKDLSSYTDITAVLVAPIAGASDPIDCEFETDGTDGIVRFTLEDGDLDEAGEWQLQLFLSEDVTPAEVPTVAITFLVEPRLVT